MRERHRDAFFPYGPASVSGGKRAASEHWEDACMGTPLSYSVSTKCTHRRASTRVPIGWRSRIQSDSIRSTMVE